MSLLRGDGSVDWKEVQAIVAVFSMLIIGVLWASSIASSVDTIRQEVLAIRATVDRGVLPRTEERIKALTERMGALEAAIKEHDRVGRGASR